MIRGDATTSRFDNGMEMVQIGYNPDTDSYSVYVDDQGAEILLKIALANYPQEAKPPRDSRNFVTPQRKNAFP